MSNIEMSVITGRPKPFILPYLEITEETYQIDVNLGIIKADIQSDGNWTLPSLSLLKPGGFLVIDNQSDFKITVDTPGSDLINGGNSFIINNRTFNTFYPADEWIVGSYSIPLNGSAILTTISNIEELRELDAGITGNIIHVLGHYSSGDDGGGLYWLDSSDTTSADNNGTIIVDAAGNRWKRKNNGILNVKVFGARGDGVSNDTAAIQAALNYLENIGGIVFFNAGTFLVDGLTMYSNIHLKGSGINATIIKLRDSANADVIVTNNAYAKMDNSDPAVESDPHCFLISDMTLDGNMNNQSPANLDRCNGLTIFGYSWEIRNLIITNCKGHGIRSKLTDALDPDLITLESKVNNIKIDRVGRRGFWFAGPHDLFVSDVIVTDASLEADDTYDGVYQESNGSGRWYNLHIWCRSLTANRPRSALYLDTGSGGNQYIGCHFEGSRRQVVIISPHHQFDTCMIYANRSLNPMVTVGNGFIDMTSTEIRLTHPDTSQAPLLQLGVAGQAAFSYCIDCRFQLYSDTTTPPIDVVNDGGGKLIARINAGNPTNLYSGILSTSSEYSISRDFNDNFETRIGKILDVAYTVGGNHRVFLGYRAGESNTGNNTVGIGQRALKSNTANTCIAIGPFSVGGNGAGNTGEANVGVGPFSQQNSTSGTRNTSLGYDSLLNITTGSNNVAVGYESGELLLAGNGNTLIGYQAGTATNAVSQGIAIGNGAVCSSNQLAIGSAAAPITTSNTAVGGAIAPPANVAAYLPVNLNGTVIKIPYYN